jgi:hypothetical protein
MFRDINTRDAKAVRNEVLSRYISVFPAARPELIEQAFGWVDQCFSGRYGDYGKIDVLYHDFEHTLQGTLCLVRLMHGYISGKAQPQLAQRMFELALLAILFHDTGYLKRSSDDGGTGAKYTLTHVSRSADFAGHFLADKGIAPAEIHSIQNMIRCTGVNADLNSIPFSNDLERNMGFALATADLLGQMAAGDYVDKLGILYLEFEESARFNGKPGGAGTFNSPDDLRRKTPIFWTNYVVPKINRDFLGLHFFLNTPPGPGHYYAERIEANIQRLERELNLATAA